jgi:hypothetical protein
VSRQSTDRSVPDAVSRRRPPREALLPSPAAARQALAAARRMQVGQVRAAVRTQLAHSHLRRQEVSQALGQLREGLLEFRTKVRSRLRESGGEIANRKTGNQTVKK